MAHTLLHDLGFMHEYQRGQAIPAASASRWASVRVPAMVGVGGKSPAWMKNGNQALAGLLPNVQHRVLPGQTHMLKAEVMAPVLTDFFKA